MHRLICGRPDVLNVRPVSLLRLKSQGRENVYFKTINTIGQVKELNRRMGLHFFDHETMTFWGARTSSLVLPTPGGAVFVTSERNFDGTERLYSVRAINGETGMVDTLERQAYKTLGGAKRAARKLAKSLNEQR